MANTKEFLLSVTQRIFSNWTALRMAVEYGCGPKERAMDFIPYITEVLYLNGRIDAGEIAIILEDYMDNYFQTELADDSSIQVAEELLRFYNYCIQSNEPMARAEFNKLPALQSWILPNVPVMKRVHQNDDSSSESDTEMDAEMESGSEQTEPVDSEWTVIKSRRRR